jgi:hypothetical protein
LKPNRPPRPASGLKLASLSKLSRGGLSIGDLKMTAKKTPRRSFTDVFKFFVLQNKNPEYDCSMATNLLAIMAEEFTDTLASHFGHTAVSSDKEFKEAFYQIANSYCCPDGFNNELWTAVEQICGITFEETYPNA